MTKTLSSFFAGLLSSGTASLAKLGSDEPEIFSALTASDKMGEPTAYALVLLELARSDGSINPSERSYIEGALSRHFSLPTSRVKIVMQRVEHLLDSARNSWSAIEAIKAEFPASERAALTEMIRGVIAADNHVDPAEEALAERISRLLGT